MIRRPRDIGLVDRIEDRIALAAEERAAIPAVLPGRWVGVDPVYDRTT